MEKTIRKYLQALETADYERILELFAPQALVLSPLYGRRTAADFYRQLLSDTSTSNITVLQIYPLPQQKKAGVNFIYQWTLANGASASFECVDLFEFDEHNRITLLKIIYDTAQTRPAFDG